MRSTAFIRLCGVRPSWSTVKRKGMLEHPPYAHHHAYQKIIRESPCFDPVLGGNAQFTGFKVQDFYNADLRGLNALFCVMREIVC